MRSTRSLLMLTLLLCSALLARAQTITIEGLKSEVTALSFSPDGKMLAAADDSFDVSLFSTDGKLLRKLNGVATKTNRVGWSPDGRVLYGTTGNEWIAFDTASGKELKKVRAEMTGTAPRCIAVSLDGKLIAASGQGRVKVWQTDTGKALGEYEPHPNYGIAAIAFSPDGKWVCTSGNDKTAALTEAATGNEGPRFTCERRLRWSEFSPDGKTIYVADEAATLHQCDIAALTDRPAPLLQTDATQLAVSRDGRYVACAGSTKVRVWDIREGKWIEHPLEDTVQGATAVAFSPDGKVLACADAPGRVRLFVAAQVLAR